MKKTSIISYVVVLFILILIGVCNYNNNPKFLLFSLNDILLLAITFFVGTYFIENYSSYEKKKEKYEKLLDKFENTIMSKDIINYKLRSGEKGEVLLNMKRLNTILDILKSKSKELKVEKEMESIYNDYNEYNYKMSAHIDAIDKIDFEDLERLRININNKCDEIRVKLF